MITGLTPLFAYPAWQMQQNRIQPILFISTCQRHLKKFLSLVYMLISICLDLFHPVIEETETSTVLLSI